MIKKLKFLSSYYIFFIYLCNLSLHFEGKTEN